MESTQGAAAKFLDPELIISQIEIIEGSLIADFGCGPGYFSVPFAKKAGIGGRVYALDILPQALESVLSKGKNVGVVNIEAKRVNLEKENGSRLDSDLLDWVILKDILFQNQNKEIIINEAARVLKPGGKILVIEWNQNEGSIGPELQLRVKQEDLKKMFEENDFSLEKEISAGDFHYCFVMRKK